MRVLTVALCIAVLAGSAKAAGKSLAFVIDTTGWTDPCSLSCK